VGDLVARELGLLDARRERVAACRIRRDELGQLVRGDGDVLRSSGEQRVEAAFMWRQPESHPHVVPGQPHR
jgi:hypothetical protein